LHAEFPDHFSPHSAVITPGLIQRLEAKGFGPFFVNPGKLIVKKPPVFRLDFGIGTAIS
jgi:hypothetical protein